MLGKEMGYEISTCEMQYDDITRKWIKQIHGSYTVASGNIAQPFMLRNLHSRACLTVSLIISFNIHDTREFHFAWHGKHESAHAKLSVWQKFPF